MARRGAELARFIESGVHRQVGACAPDGAPLICRALAGAVEPDGRLVTLLSAVSGAAVLEAIRATGRATVVVTLPTSFRAFQLKGRDAVAGPAGPGWRSLLQQQHRLLDEQLATLGFGGAFTAGWYALPDDELALVRFTPYGVWNQTPGVAMNQPVELEP